MKRVFVCHYRSKIANLLSRTLSEQREVSHCHELTLQDAAALNENSDYDVGVFAPDNENLQTAEQVYAACKRAGLEHMILLSSSEVYGAHAANSGQIEETTTISPKKVGHLGQSWLKIELLAKEYLGENLTILRPSEVLGDDSGSFYSKFFGSKTVFTRPFRDPSLQFLHVEDLARGIACALASSPPNVFNVAPDSVIPLWQAIALSEKQRIPVAVCLQKLLRKARPSLDKRDSPEHLEYLSYSNGISSHKIRTELGFHSSYSSAESFFDHIDMPVPENLPAYDLYGLDQKYIDRGWRWFWRFANDYYWRTELSGFENIPKEGRAVLAGNHRGLIPADGVIVMNQIREHLGRTMRFLIHPGLVKSAPAINFNKMGGVIACRANADWALQRDQLLGYFPEGIQGAFSYYRNTYQLGRFGRDEFVKAALRNSAPIVPFVSVGTAEIFPIIAKINWRWWQKNTLWPCFPIAPPWPLLPMPLPSKWHIKFLEPLHIEKHHPPSAAEDADTVREISDQIRVRMQTAINEMLKSRKSVFWGNIFK